MARPQFAVQRAFGGRHGGVDLAPAAATEPGKTLTGGGRNDGQRRSITLDPPVGDQMAVYRLAVGQVDGGREESTI